MESPQSPKAETAESPAQPASPPGPSPFQIRVLSEMRKSGEINHIKAILFSQVLQHAIKSNKLKPLFNFAEVVDLKSFAIANCIVHAYLKAKLGELPMTNESLKAESHKQFKITANGTERDLKFKRKGFPIKDLLDFHRAISKPSSPPRGVTRSFLPRSPKALLRSNAVAKVDPNTRYSDDEEVVFETVQRKDVSKTMLALTKTVSHVRQDSQDSDLDLEK